jgi:hypothetical protein
MHYAFTPELEGSNIHGAIARGSHFYCWSRLTDTLRAVWRLHLTGSRITNAEHNESWSLFDRMLLHISLNLETGSSLPCTAVDIGALLVLILRRIDLGFNSDTDTPLKITMEIADLRAQIVLSNVQSNQNEIYKEWERLDGILSYWIENQCDLDLEETARLERLV